MRKEAEALCSQLEAMHPPNVKDELVEMCEGLFEAIPHVNSLTSKFFCVPFGAIRHVLTDRSMVAATDSDVDCGDRTTWMKSWTRLKCLIHKSIVIHS